MPQTLLQCLEKSGPVLALLAWFPRCTPASQILSQPDDQSGEWDSRAPGLQGWMRMGGLGMVDTCAGEAALWVVEVWWALTL